MNKKLIILLTVFIDVLGIGIIIPILPFYVESYGATATTVTLLFAVYSLGRWPRFWCDVLSIPNGRLRI